MVFREIGKSGIEKIQASGRERRFHQEIQEKIQRGLREGEAQRAVLIERMENLRKAIEQTGRLDVNSNEWKEVETALNIIFPDSYRKGKFEEKVKPEVPSPKLKPSTLEEEAQSILEDIQIQKLKDSFAKEFGGYVPDDEILREITQRSKKVYEILGDLIGNEEFSKSDNLLKTVHSNPELVEALGRLSLEAKALKLHDSAWQSELARRESAQATKEYALEFLGHTFWEGPLKFFDAVGDFFIQLGKYFRSWEDLKRAITTLEIGKPFVSLARDSAKILGTEFYFLARLSGNGAMYVDSLLSEKLTKRKLEKLKRSMEKES